MKPIILFVLLLFITASCQPTKVPGQLAWDYEYRMAYPDTLDDSLKYLYDMSDYDSSNVHFRIFSHLTPDTLDTTAWDSVKFDTLAIVKQPIHEIWLLEHKQLYINKSFSFFAQTVLIDSLNYQYNWSAHSDTIHVFMPVLPIGKPIELFIIKIPLE